ncbi:hypothetical protein [Pantoea cypripedii]|uniref:Uncharacterized protein n=1 Tax=Pantoea cypripedii TaxID=55209 RepID=A0A6B9GF00_PANCY|nr:hypothetical protein [Pantoea cypripedii]QGY31596.1 hypothetical protein CUN67_21660 [Pantoea cypripedii]
MQTKRIAYFLTAGLILSAFSAMSLPAFAVDLPFSANCTNYAQIQVTAPNTGITFRKNPNSPATRAATATIFAIQDMHNISFPANASSCFFAIQAPHSDNYCFQASNNPQAFTNINAVANTNVAGAPNCQ